MTDANTAVVRQWAQATFNEHDLDAAAEFLAPDWVGHWVGLPEGHGVTGFKRLAGAYLTAFPDMQVIIEDALADGDKLVRRVSWTATHRGVVPRYSGHGEARSGARHRHPADCGGKNRRGVGDVRLARSAATARRRAGLLVGRISASVGNQPTSYRCGACESELGRVPPGLGCG